MPPWSTANAEPHGIQLRRAEGDIIWPKYRLERLTGSGKRIYAVYATLTPFQ